MFHHAIGHKTFIKGVVLFLTKFKYSVADEDDLFGALETVIEEDHANIFKYSEGISSIMRTWTLNRGIPIITVIRNYDNGTITFRQICNINDSNEKWWIPLSFATASNPNFDQTKADLILPPQTEFTIRIEDINLDISDNEWLIVNKQQTGLFTVIYDDKNLGLIAKALNTDYKKIHMFNRALLFRDFGALDEQDLDDINPLLSALQYLKYEKDIMPWGCALPLILELLWKLNGSNLLERFKWFIRSIVGDIFQETSIDSITRSNIIEVACIVDLAECLTYTKTLTKEHVFNGKEFDETIIDTVICHGIKYSSTEEFVQLLAKMGSLRTKSVEDYRIVGNINCIEATEKIKSFLKLLFGQNVTMDIGDLEKMEFVALTYTYNYFSRPVIMDFLLENYKTAFKNSSVIEDSLTSISYYVSEYGGQKDKFMLLLTNIRNYFGDMPNLEDFEIGSKLKELELFKEKYEDSISKWLNNYYLLQPSF